MYCGTTESDALCDGCGRGENGMRGWPCGCRRGTNGAVGPGTTATGRKGGSLREGVVGVDGSTGSGRSGTGGSACVGGGPGALRDGVDGLGSMGDGGGCGNGCVGGGAAGRMAICRGEAIGDERTGVAGACKTGDTALKGVLGVGARDIGIDGRARAGIDGGTGDGDGECECDGTAFAVCSDGRGGVEEGVATRASGGLARSFLECKTGLDARVEVLKFSVRGVKPDRVGDEGVATRCFKGLGFEGTAIGGIAGTGGM